MLLITYPPVNINQNLGNFDIKDSIPSKRGDMALHKRYYIAMWLKRIHLKQY